MFLGGQNIQDTIRDQIDNGVDTVAKQTFALAEIFISFNAGEIEILSSSILEWMIASSIPIVEQFKDSELCKLLKIYSLVVPRQTIDEVHVVLVVSPSHLDLPSNLLNDVVEVLTDFSLGAVTAVIHTIHVVR